MNLLLRFVAAVGLCLSTSLQAQTNVFPGSGNVGVGTTNPGTSLFVKGEFTSAYMQLAVQAASSDDRAGVSFWNASGTTRLASFYAGNDGHSYLSGTELGSGTFHIYSAGAERMTFLPSGNVGIGTASPSHKLSVNGTIRAKEVIVEASPWPDDVFDAGYKLKALSEVAAHIEEHGHLPDVPNAATVAEQGISVGEMQATLVRKIEELTLYMIELKEENAELRRRVEKMEGQR